MYKEHKLASGETMVLTDENPFQPSSEPYAVFCVAATDDELRWSKSFATLAEAEAEYVRFDK